MLRPGIERMHGSRVPEVEDLSKAILASIKKQNSRPKPFI